MIVTNGLDISSRDFFGRREDLSFIVRFHWKTSNHLKEAIQVLLAARLDDGTDGGARSARSRSDVLDEAEFEQIRLQIASNPTTPAVVLDYLARHGSASVMERVAENAQTSVSALERLAQCPHPQVRAAVAENRNASPDILTILATDPSVDVRFRIAENPHLAKETLEALTSDSNPYVSYRASATLSRVAGGRVVEAPFQERGRSTFTRLQAISGQS